MTSAIRERAREIAIGVAMDCGTPNGDLCQQMIEQALLRFAAEVREADAQLCEKLADFHKAIAAESAQGRADAEPFIHTAQTLADSIRETLSALRPGEAG